MLLLIENYIQTPAVVITYLCLSEFLKAHASPNQFKTNKMMQYTNTPSAHPKGRALVFLFLVPWLYNSIHAYSEPHNLDFNQPDIGPDIRTLTGSDISVTSNGRTDFTICSYLLRVRWHKSNNKYTGIHLMWSYPRKSLVKGEEFVRYEKNPMYLT